MTALNHINTHTIISFFQRSRCYMPIRLKYKLNYNCITFFLSCYLLQTIKGKPFTITQAFRFVSYYKFYIVSRYISLLVENNLLSLSGRLYSITDLGLQAIAEISQNNDRVLYEFCNKHGIVL
jgi:predicted transcriptional regulator